MRLGNNAVTLSKTCAEVSKKKMILNKLSKLSKLMNFKYILRIQN